MGITYGFDANGGFFAHDADAKILEYGYPTSDHATKALRNPAKIAAKMVGSMRPSIAHYLTLQWYQERSAYLASKFHAEVAK